MIKNNIISVIRLYQKYISPDHSLWAKKANRLPYCKYTPSCSQYCIEAIEKKGTIRGVILGLWRILRCNPFSKGGFDPVDKESYQKP